MCKVLISAPSKCDLSRMATPALQMLTANRLRDGDVVYWRAAAGSRRSAKAMFFAADAEAEAALAKRRRNSWRAMSSSIPISSRYATRRAAHAGERARIDPRRRPDGARRSGQTSRGPRPTRAAASPRATAAARSPPGRRRTTMYRYDEFDAAFVRERVEPVPLSGGAPA